MVRRVFIPDLVDTTKGGMLAWADRVIEAVSQITGVSANTTEAKLDSAVTYRDLIDQGFAVLAPDTSPNFVIPGTDSSADSIIPPPSPSGFQVERLPFGTRLTWDAPTYPNPYATEIWRASTDNLTAARMVAVVLDGLEIWEDGYAQAPVFYWIRGVSKAGITGAFNAISGTSAESQPGDVIGLGYTLEATGIRIAWTAVTAPDLDVYEIRLGATWDSATKLAETKATFFLWPTQATGTYRIWVRARDVSGFYSGSASSIDVIIADPSTAAPIYSLSGDTVTLSWAAVGGSFLIDYYEVRYGDTWAGGTLANRTFATSLSLRVDWGGVRRYWVAARDVAGNYGTPTSVDITIIAPGSVASIRAEVVDNNVLLYWTAPSAGTLPIQTYEIRKGSDFSTATLVGEKTGLFTSVFEMAAGSYTYWVRARDTAGNYGTAAPVTVAVQQPPDFVLYADQNLDLSAATLSSAYYEPGAVTLPFNTTETYDAHYTARSWTKDDDAISAGFPVYAQPAPTTGYIESTIDLGVAVPATSVTVTPTLEIVAGAPTNAVQISHKLNIGDSWTDLSVGPTGFIATSFRYLKVRVTATTSASGVGLYRCTGINVKVAVKQRTDAGQGYANAGDSGGTTVTLNYPFLDLFGPPLIQPVGTTPIIAVVDFTDVPNPTTFKVLCFNLAGTRVSCDFSWTARGV